MDPGGAKEVQPLWGVRQPVNCMPHQADACQQPGDRQTLCGGLNAPAGLTAHHTDQSAAAAVVLNEVNEQVVCSPQALLSLASQHSCGRSTGRACPARTRLKAIAVQHLQQSHGQALKLRNSPIQTSA